MIRRIGFGGLLWLIPFVTAMRVLPLIQNDNMLFKTIMIVEGALLGAALAVVHFQSVQRDFLFEGVLTAAVWIVVGWLLDLAVLLPFTGQTIWRYFAEIGLRYLAIAAPCVAVGYALEQRQNPTP